MADIETFDLYEMATGATYPEVTVPITLNGKLAYEISTLEGKINSEGDNDKVVELEKELAELYVEFNKTKLDVVIKGLPPYKRDQVSNELDAEFGADEESKMKAEKAYVDAFEAAYYLASIKEVVNAEGHKASVADWDRDKMAQWCAMIPVYYRDNLMNAISEVTLQAEFYEDVEISTGF